MRGRGPLSGRSLTAIDGAIALIAVILVVQMWLLTATLEGVLAGHRSLAVPASVISGLLFLGAFSLYLFLMRVDRGVRARAAAEASKEAKPGPGAA
jgi:hypothetical protein